MWKVNIRAPLQNKQHSTHGWESLEASSSAKSARRHLRECYKKKKKKSLVDVTLWRHRSPKFLSWRHHVTSPLGQRWADPRGTDKPREVRKAFGKGINAVDWEEKEGGFGVRILLVKCTRDLASFIGVNISHTPCALEGLVTAHLSEPDQFAHMALQIFSFVSEPQHSGVVNEAITQNGVVGNSHALTDASTHSASICDDHRENHREKRRLFENSLSRFADRHFWDATEAPEHAT